MSRMEEIEARLKAATRGPWEFDGNEINNVPDYASDNPAPWSTVLECRVECGSYCYGGSLVMDIAPENKALIESAPADIYYLLATIDKLSALAGRIDATFTTNNSVDVQMRATAYQIRAAIAGDEK